MDHGADGGHHGSMKQNVVDLRVARVLKAVQAEPSRRFTVRDLAKLAGASRASFVRLFLVATGESPQRWLRARRLEQAAHLLISGDERLADIAARVGYVSEFALSRAFKRRYGLSPAVYRRQSLTLRCAA
jgi:transcriptional regulator GlxA family with amidase domain